MKTPIETDFKLEQRSANSIEATFLPTESTYTFHRQPDGSVSLQNFRHAKTGDTDKYPEHEVLEMATRLAMALPR
jgi:hypothetical protein